MTKFLADECCDVVLVRGLRVAGQDIAWVAERSPGVDDQNVLRLAFGENRILLTEDQDFGELVVRLSLETHGVVLIRLNPADAEAKLARVREASPTRRID